jgi:8-oxo-dGTP pyrophosphatase MutT (NUDIX family)
VKRKKINASGGVIFQYINPKVDRAGQKFSDSVLNSKDWFDKHQANQQYLQVLLIYRNGLWDIPKGKVEKKETIANAARREVQEEVGIQEPIITHYIGSTTHEYEQKNKSYHKTTYWYGMIDAQEHRLPFLKSNKVERFASNKQYFSPQIEEGITDVRWVSVTQAHEMVAFENLKEVLRRFTDQINRPISR